MKRLLTVVFLVGLFGVRHSSGSELTFRVKSNQETLAEYELKIEGDSATATAGDEIEKFNLKDMSWLDEKSGRWITLTQCKAWAGQSKIKTSKSTASAPAHVREFVLWSMEPTFEVEKSNGNLKLISGKVDYVIEGEASKSDVEKYYRYAVLNAFKKAMTEKKLPPFAELKAIDEMQKLGYIPRRISVAIPGIDGAPTIELEIAQSMR